MAETAPSSRSWLAPTDRRPRRASRPMSAQRQSNWLDPVSLRSPTGKNNQHRARARNQETNRARDFDYLLSFGSDFERPCVGDLFLAGVSDLWRHEQCEAEQD